MDKEGAGERQMKASKFSSSSNINLPANDNNQIREGEKLVSNEAKLPHTPFPQIVSANLLLQPSHIPRQPLFKIQYHLCHHLPASSPSLLLLLFHWPND